MVKYMKLNFNPHGCFFTFTISGCGKKADPLAPVSQNIVAK